MDGAIEMNYEKISVIVPVYKVEPCLRRCLDSIVRQTYQNLEIILIDDGSPDNSGAICDEYAAQDERVRVIHQENKGTMAARYAGIQMACGEYVGFADADDYVEPEMYARMYEEACAAQADLVMCAYFEVFGGKRYPCKIKIQSAVIKGPTAPVDAYIQCVASIPSLWNKLYRRSLFNGLQKPLPLKIGEDMALCTALAPYVKKAVILPEALYCYVIHTDSVMHRRQRMDDGPNPLDQFLHRIAPDAAYDTADNTWKYLLASQAFISVVYTNCAYAQGIAFFWAQLEKLRTWELFDGFCRAIISGRCLKPIQRVGGLSTSLSVAVRVVFLLCRLRLYGAAALLLMLLRKMLEVVLALRMRMKRRRAGRTGALRDI